MNALDGWLYVVAMKFRKGERPTEINSQFGTHGVTYGDDEFGPYATVGFNLANLSHGAYAEIEDGTFGELQGFRFYFEESFT